MSDGNRELREALARGYCSSENSHKELDAVLIEAMVKEVAALSLPTPCRSGVGREAIGATAIVKQIVEVYDGGHLRMESEEIGEPENGIPLHPWHEELLYHARRVVAAAPIDAILALSVQGGVKPSDRTTTSNHSTISEKPSAR